MVWQVEWGRQAVGKGSGDSPQLRVQAALVVWVDTAGRELRPHIGGAKAADVATIFEGAQPALPGTSPRYSILEIGPFLSTLPRGQIQARQLS
jgi:hypothetical protein